VNGVLRGAIFDFDGVIVDSHPVHKRAWKKLLESVGRGVSDEELQFVLDGKKREEILRHFLGDLDPRLMSEYSQKKERFFQNEAAAVQTIEGVEGFLEDLAVACVTCGIASSGSASRVNFLLDRFDLKRHFKAIVTGDDIKTGKPNPAIFLRAAQDVQLDPSELIAFEDAQSGIMAARSAGMMCIGIAQPDRESILLGAGANFVLPDFRSLSHSVLREMFAPASRSKIECQLTCPPF
jgi:beta-phosphoglucomutase